MKTTIDIPEPLYKEAKIGAIRRGLSLKDLVLSALQRELHPETSESPSIHASSPKRYRKDPGGWPVLKRKKGDDTIVTEDFIEKLREDEGI